MRECKCATTLVESFRNEFSDAGSTPAISTKTKSRLLPTFLFCSVDMATPHLRNIVVNAPWSVRIFSLFLHLNKVSSSAAGSDTLFRLHHRKSCRLVRWDFCINVFRQLSTERAKQTTTRYAGAHRKLYKKITFRGTIRLFKSIVNKER